MKTELKNRIIFLEEVWRGGQIKILAPGGVPGGQGRLADMEGEIGEVGQGEGGQG